MPTLVQITAYPTIRYRTDSGHVFRQTSFGMGQRLPHHTICASRLDEVRDAVARFGAAVQVANPGASFSLSARPLKGQRKLRGWDAMESEDRFGGDAWVKEQADGTAPKSLLQPPMDAAPAQRHEPVEAPALAG